jgi:anti-anti-sigma factor
MSTLPANAVFQNASVGLQMCGPNGTVHAVILRGDLDMDVVTQVDTFLRRAFGPFFFRRTLLLDFAEVTMLDSTFVGYLVSLAGRVRQAGFDLVLTRPGGQARRTLALVGMPNLVPVYDSLEEAADLVASGRVPMIPPPLPFRQDEAL